MAIKYLTRRSRLSDFLWSQRVETHKPDVLFPFTVSELGSHYTNLRDLSGIDSLRRSTSRPTHIYLCHWEKHRPRFTQKKDQHGNTISTAVKVGYWQLSVYRIPTDRVYECQQFARHFTVTLKY